MLCALLLCRSGASVTKKYRPRLQPKDIIADLESFYERTSPITKCLATRQALRDQLSKSAITSSAG